MRQVFRLAHKWRTRRVRAVFLRHDTTSGSEVTCAFIILETINIYSISTRRVLTDVSRLVLFVGNVGTWVTAVTELVLLRFTSVHYVCGVDVDSKSVHKNNSDVVTITNSDAVLTMTLIVVPQVTDTVSSRLTNCFSQVTDRCVGSVNDAVVSQVTDLVTSQVTVCFVVLTTQCLAKN